MSTEMLEAPGGLYCYSTEIRKRMEELSARVIEFRKSGALTPDVLHNLRKYFRIKNIYNSNAIEGNLLNLGETRQVVEFGLTITGKPLKDQAEAKNLSEAIDYLEVLAGDSCTPIVESDIRQIHALILKGINDDNAGKYRTVPVEISGSKYKPPSPEKVSSEMMEFGAWLKSDSCPDDRFAAAEGLLFAALAHVWLVYIHPFIDGNGRVARLLLNLILMRYGFPIAIISRDDRLRYYDALEFSQRSDLTPFLALMLECIEESLEEYETAAKEKRERIEWVSSLASKLSERENKVIRNEYEIWKHSMELFKGYMRQTADMMDQAARPSRIYFSDYGIIDFEKYFILRQNESAKRTWFFRIDFKSGKKAIRYLFFFGRRAPAYHSKCFVTLHVSREDPPNSFSYERLSHLPMSSVPSLIEVGYDINGQIFLALKKNNQLASGKIEEIGRRFFEEITSLHFSV